MVARAGVSAGAPLFGRPWLTLVSLEGKVSRSHSRDGAQAMGRRLPLGRFRSGPARACVGRRPARDVSGTRLGGPALQPITRGPQQICGSKENVTALEAQPSVSLVSEAPGERSGKRLVGEHSLTNDARGSLHTSRAVVNRFRSEAKSLRALARRAAANSGTAPARRGY